MNTTRTTRVAVAAALVTAALGTGALGTCAVVVPASGTSASSMAASPIAASPMAASPMAPTPMAAGPASVSPSPMWTAPAPAAAVVAPRAVLPSLDPAAPQPSPAALAALLAPLVGAKALGGSETMDVVDVTTGRHLAGKDPSTAHVAASTIKLLTGTAALSTLGAGAGAGEGLPTTVVAGASANQIVLVGGGDVLLTSGAGDPTATDGHAGLADLAKATAASLRARGVMSVSLRLDDTLFTGPSVSPTWAGRGYVAGGFVAPVTPIAVDAGRVRPGHYARRRAEPALAAAQAFAAQLRSQGVTVTGALGRARAPEGAAVLGRVTGAPLGDVVEYTLTTSDNTVAEVLARLVAHATGRPATFAGAGAAVLAQDAGLGVPVAGASLSGGSGLGPADKVPAATLTAVLSLAASADHPELRPVLTGLPVAAATGTLADRFTAPAVKAARGAVRAKTGSLSGVNTLAGVVVDADGRLLAFALLADRTGPTVAARAALDRFGALLAGCGCR